MKLCQCRRLSPSGTSHESDACQEDQFFQICTVNPTQRSGRCDCDSIFLTNSARLLDASLLLVSEQIRKEALTVLFERNNFQFDGETKLGQVRHAFEGLLGRIRSCSLITIIRDDPLTGRQIDLIKKPWAPFTALQKLIIWGTTIYKKATEFFEEGVLNVFRPMAFLPLISFELHFPEQRYGRVPETVGRRLSLRAEDILLKDPILPEEEQVKPTSTDLSGVEETKRSRFTRKVGKASVWIDA
jgi:hypothetical protein